MYMCRIHPETIATSLYASVFDYTIKYCVEPNKRQRHRFARTSTRKYTHFTLIPFAPAKWRCRRKKSLYILATMIFTSTQYYAKCFSSIFIFLCTHIFIFIHFHFARTQIFGFLSVKWFWIKVKLAPNTQLHYVSNAMCAVQKINKHTASYTQTKGEGLILLFF